MQLYRSSWHTPWGWKMECTRVTITYRSANGQLQAVLVCRAPTWDRCQAGWAALATGPFRIFPILAHFPRNRCQLWESSSDPHGQNKF